MQENIIGTCIIDRISFFDKTSIILKNNKKYYEYGKDYFFENNLFMIFQHR
jgi:hypothetical protein